MGLDLEPAIAFGTLLREDSRAAEFYDNCTPAQRQKIILQLHNVPAGGMKTFVEQLPAIALN